MKKSKYLNFFLVVVFILLSINVNAQIIPHLNHSIGEGNLIYSSTFQLAWNELSDNVIKDEIKLNKSEELVNELNKRIFTKDALSEDSYLVFSGDLIKENINKFNKKITKKFGNEMALIEDSPNPLSKVVYAYLYKNLMFQTQFEKTESIDFKVSNNHEEKIKSFGIENYKENEHFEIAKQVKVFNYKNNDNFIIQLNSLKIKSDKIILAKIKPQETLAETVNYVLENLKNGEPLKEKDILRIPEISFDKEYEFSELKNALFLNKGWKSWYIEEAKQWIKFDLNKQGAVLKSVAKMQMTRLAMNINNNVPKNLTFNKPFLLMLKEEGENEPYLVIWINDVNILVNDKS